MNTPPAGGTPAPLSRIAAGGLARLGAGCALLVMVGIAVTSSGGAGLTGRLGGLFGFRAQPRPAPAVRAVEPLAPVRPVATLSKPATRSVSHTKRRPSPRRPVHSVPRQSPPAPAAPAVTLAPPVPVEVRTPAPPPSGNVGRVVQRVREVAAPVLEPVAPAQQVVRDATTVVGQVCGLLGGCP